MTVKNAPGTPLPWFPRENTDGQCVVGAHNAKGGFSFPLEAEYDARNGKADVAYAVHAANKYPLLVEALRRLASECQNCEERFAPTGNAAVDLLRELGELEPAEPRAPAVDAEGEEILRRCRAYATVKGIE